MQRPQRVLLVVLRGTAVGVAATLLWRVFATADTHRVAALVTSVGVFGVVLVLCPQLAALGFESLGWQRAFRAGGARPRFRSLLRVRLATEALAQSLPVGVAFAESTKPILLAKHCGLSVDQSVAGMAARKVLLLLAQSLYVGGLAALGFAGLEAASRAVIGAPHLGLLTLGAALVLATGGVGSALLLRESALAKTAFSLIERVPSARVRAWLDAKRRVFFATDNAVSALFRVPPQRLAGALACFACGWLMESLETWLILSVLGAPVSFVTAGSLEVILSLVRNVVFVVPAGLGVQDLGYAACFAALGVPEAASLGAAFVLLKRGKELFWIAFGYALLAGDFGVLSARRDAASTPPPAPAVARLRPARA
ncbi:MAG TPA: lysylphosphatidylglycerol synthase domain-containing protein [Polyangiaceae bacterium]|nr:lysylphosphatidylglycerol synthase domain-containing protein [Polyangiaceae bacterium]